MHREVIVKSRSLGAASDLSLLAPIKPGFADALDTLTYKSRIKRVLAALHGARTLSHEHAFAQLLSDSVERVGVIHSVRVAVLEPEDKVLLAVTFDGPWEAYIRVLWEKVGTLLDLIFHDTVDYVNAFENTFDAWRHWGQRVQVETGFFYGPPESTARDAWYWRRVDRMQQRADLPSATPDAGDSARWRQSLANALRAELPTAEAAVETFVTARPSVPPDEPGYNPVTEPRMVRERVRNGLRGLATLYRLTDLYRPGTPAGDVLRRAALDLLREFVDAYADGAGVAKDPIRDARHGEGKVSGNQGRFARQLDWLLPEGGQRPVRTGIPPAPRGNQLPPAILAAVQGGILRPYSDITHGLVVFVELVDSAAAVAFLDWTVAHMTPGNHGPAAVGGPAFCNIAFTQAGLRACGLQEGALELFPEEFRVGMTRRAGLLGDVRNHHPLRWRLPPPPAGGPGVEPENTHAAVTLRCTTVPGSPEEAAVDLADPHHPLQSDLAALAALPGVRIAAVQPMRRLYADATRTSIREHFGYQDGNGEPAIEQTRPPYNDNLVHPGEVLVGQTNAGDRNYLDDPDTAPAQVAARLDWLGNGTFVAMRRYRQDVHRLRTVVHATAATLPGGATTANEELVYAKMMGRYRDGTPVVFAAGSGPRNNFRYDDNAACPLGAHIRLANPRRRPTIPPTGARPPRLVRRSMSYGPEFDPAHPTQGERGLVFVALCASLAEQYEVVQRWLNGANASGTHSGRGCPFTGVPDNGVQKTFHFEHGDLVAKVELDPTTTPGTGPQLFEEPSTLARLDWGVYLFMPSLAALGRIRVAAHVAASRLPAAPAVPWDLARGRRLIASLQDLRALQGDAAALVAWKAAVEDPESIDRLDAASLWAAIRQDHGGLLQTPYGTLVASRELLGEVLRDAAERYSVSGQLARMKKSFGEITLGLDASAEYWADSDPVNDAIHALTTPPPAVTVYAQAFEAARHKIEEIVSEAQSQSQSVGDRRFEVGFDAREVLDAVLARLSEHWFGLQEGSAFLAAGSTDWNWQPGDRPLYPGHFTALSRYMFQPHPGVAPEALGQAYGQALRDAMTRFVESLRPDPANSATWRLPSAPGGHPAPIAEAIFQHPVKGHDSDFVARTIVGVLMGFTPTIIGALLNVLREWWGASRFHALRAELAMRTDEPTVRGVILAPMNAAARMRPMPQIAWRTVRKAHHLGPMGPHGVDLAVGDKIVLAFVAGTQQSLADGADAADTARLMFGGVRTFDKLRQHPTHACPGFEAGMQAMLGTLAALLAAPHTVRAGTSATAFIVEGDVPAVPAPPVAATLLLATAAVDQRIELATHFRKRWLTGGLLKDTAFTSAAGAIRNPPSGRQGVVFGWGDSWLDYRLPGMAVSVGTDVRDFLDQFDYRAPEEFCNWERWTTIAKMASNTAAFCSGLTSWVQTNPGVDLRAIVLSGGGNDVAGTILGNMLERWPVPASGPFKANEFTQTMTKLHDDYVKVVKDVLACLDQLVDDGSLPPGSAVPIVIHGYDYPYPRGKSPLPFPLPGFDFKDWLVKPFRRADYDLGDPAAFAAAVSAMRTLMEELRSKLAAVAGRYPGRVRQVDLLGTIESCWPADPMAHWANDLHPKDDAYEQIAIRIDDAINAATWP